jgi:outer membrane protein assembly factor BamB
MRVLFLFTLVCLSAEAHWPQFRGPDARGVDDSVALPLRWNVTTGENVRWKTPLPGLAHSSPIVWDKRIYVTTAVRPGDTSLKVGLYGDIESVEEKDPHQWRLICLDGRSGEVQWNTLGLEAIPRVQRHPKGSACSSTPATDGKHVVAIFGSEGLFCFDSNGQLLWKKDLGPMDSGYYRSPTAQWGFASSPVIYEGKVVVQCDVQTNSFLAVFDINDGRELWRTRRQDVPTWSTPTIAASGSGANKQIVVNGWHHTGGYTFDTGQEIWKLDGGGDIPVPAPIVANGLIYLTTAHGRYRPMRAVRTDAQGDITPPDPGQTNTAIVWAHARKGNYMQTPIVVGDLLFGCFDNGVLTCFDARTGKIHYEERLGSGQGFTASPVSDGRHLFVSSEVGEVFVVPTRKTFTVAATNTLNETQMATPAIADGSLLFRTRGHLVAIGNKE